MLHTVQRFLAEEEGATAIEYGLICSLIFLVILSGLSAFADSANALWTTIATHVH